MHWWPASNKPKPTCMKLWMDFRIIEVAEKNILNGLVEMFHSQSLWDVHFFFKCGNSIGAHVVVFQSAGSPVFNVMFQSEFVDIKMEVFKQFFYFRSSCTPAKHSKWVRIKISVSYFTKRLINTTSGTSKTNTPTSY
jgi:hypothetical protein